MRTGKFISFYVARSIIPYFLYAWLILSVILFAQQSGRYSEILFNIDLPASLLWQLAFALVPSVVAFTSPMAILLGVIIGLSKMQSDSEIVSMRAAGVSNFSIILPVAILGIIASLFAFWVNIYGVPMAAGAVRQVALQSAIKKLESPFEPGKFNTDVPGYTFYMRSGDIETGLWNDIFVFNEDDKNLTLRLITSSTGRVDSSDTATELVLDRAEVTSIPYDVSQNKVVSETLGEIRFSLRTGRADLVEKLTNSDRAVEELGLGELTNTAAGADDEKQRTDALILRQRRILLSISPLVFCLLGAGIVLRFNRGSRGFAVATALTVLIGYYLLAFLGEQLARTGTISALVASFLPIIGSLAAGIWLFVTHTGSFVDKLLDRAGSLFERIKPNKKRLSRLDVLADISTGLRDLDISLNIGRIFVSTLIFLLSIFFIFTGFEVWKFAGTFEGGPALLVKYLIYLTPFAYLQIAPSALMIAVLAVFLIKSRNNEIVTWIAAGQSVYRLLLPAVAMSIAIGAINFGIQELVAPGANAVQDATRTLIRDRGIEKPDRSRRWVYKDGMVYGVGVDQERVATEKDGSELSASDNENDVVRKTLPRAVLTGKMDHKSFRLQDLYLSGSAIFDSGKLRLSEDALFVDLVAGEARLKQVSETTFDVSPRDLIAEKKAAQMTLTDLIDGYENNANETVATGYRLEFHRRLLTIFLPFVMVIFAAPFAISMTRTGKAAMAGYAVAMWLLFSGVFSLFVQLALSGQFPPILAAWFPPIAFSFLGLFLIGRVRT